MCLGLCIPAWADDVYSRASNLFFGWSISASDKYADMMLNDCGLDLSGKYYYVSRDLNGKGHWTYLCVSDFPFILDTSSVDNAVLVSSSSGASFWEYHFSDVYKKTELYSTKPSVYTCKASSSSRIIVVSSNFFDNGGSSDNSYAYDSNIPAPANVRYVKTGENTAGLVWDNNDPDDKYHVVIRGVFHWKNNNPVGSWIQNNTPFTGDSSGDVTVQLLDSSDQYKVSRSGYSIPDDKFEEVKAAVAKEAKKSATWWSWYPSEFQVQYFGYDENGKKIFGDAAICKINWSNVKKGEWTSSTMIYSGGVKDDTGADGEQSTTHVTDWGEVMGGGGASWDDSNEYDSSGNIVKSDASKNTLQDFINGLVNIPDILNRFFQTIQVLMSGISQLPALFSTIVSYMPPEFVSLLGMGLVVVIILRIFGR